MLAPHQKALYNNSSMKSTKQEIQELKSLFKDPTNTHLFSKSNRFTLNRTYLRDSITFD